MSNVTIKILNWEKYNPRKDVKKPSWFRLENTLFFDPDLGHFSGEELAVLIYFFSYASFKDRDSFTADLKKVSERARVSFESVQSSVDKLRVLNIIEVSESTSRVRNVDVTYTGKDVPSTDSHPPLRTDVRDERTRRDETYVRTVEKAKLKDPTGLATVDTPVGKIREAFLEAYRKEFKRDYPGWGAKENGQAKNWLKSVPLEKCLELCELYPRWNDPYIVRVGHPFGLLCAQYVQVSAWARSPDQLIQKIAHGKAVENIDIKRAVEREENIHALREAQLTNQRFEHALGRGQVPAPIPAGPQGGIRESDNNPFDESIFDDSGE